MSLIITSGEPAGIGPDIVIKAAFEQELDAVVLADIDLMRDRAYSINRDVEIIEYQGQNLFPKKGRLYVWHEPLMAKVYPGKTNPENASYVLMQLDQAIDGCLQDNFQAMVTAPICKATINESGIDFSGHTEYLAARTDSKEVVMMLASKAMRVALVTTHLPLSEVPKAITQEKVKRVVATVLRALKTQWGINKPRVMVAGLNPHAGEDGYLGREEIDIIRPALGAFSSAQVAGPLPADTMFSVENCKIADAFIAMYHDQGLSVLKYASFGDSVNITLGLPIVRTSVDHGTALNIASTGKACEQSLLMAIAEATRLSNCVSTKK